MSLSDSELVGRLVRLARAERATLGEVLRLLREVEDRRLHIERAHPSLFTFCVKELGYSEHEAFARIQVTRLMKTVPEVVSAVEEGRIGITVAAMVQVQFRRAEKKKCPIQPEGQAAIVRSLYGISKRDAEKILAELFPGGPAREKASHVGNGMVELEFLIPEALWEQIQTLFSIRSHTNPEKRWDKLIGDLVKLGWKKWHPNGRANESPRPGDGATRH